MNSSGASGKDPESIRSIRTRLLQLLHSGDRGSAVVELALAMPVMLFLMTGIYSFSNAIHQKLVLAEAVSVGGRVLAAARGDSDPCTITTAAIEAAAPSITPANLTLTYTIAGTSQGKGTTSCDTNGTSPMAAMVSGATAQIQASYTCSLGLYGHNLGTCTINEQITEVIQ
jgi:Flp pilus assembly protein TadG